MQILSNLVSPKMGLGQVTARKPAMEKSPASPADSFQASAPPVWRRALNSAVGGLGGAAIVATAATALVAAMANGPAALGAPLVGIAIGGPIGLVAGAVAGWKNTSRPDASSLRKLANAVTWGVAGAAAGAAAAVGIATASLTGSSALAGLMAAVPGAAVGAGLAATAGWKIAHG